VSLFQNSVSFRTSSSKNRAKPVCSIKSKEAVPKTEVLEQPQVIVLYLFHLYKTILAPGQGIGVYFFNIILPLKTAYFEEKIIVIFSFFFVIPGPGLSILPFRAFFRPPPYPIGGVWGQTSRPTYSAGNAPKVKRLSIYSHAAICYAGFANARFQEYIPRRRL
jgi:hypothetical protein